MNMRLIFGLGLGLLVGILIVTRPSHAQSSASLAHTDRTFEFIAFAPMSRVAPLFGAERERDWSHDWNPIFVWPYSPSDREGMVFTVAHGDKQSVWVNTLYDPEHGRFQYVYVIPNVMATLLTLTLQPREAHTIVKVRYERTALSADASSVVQSMAQQDDRAAPDWERQVNTYLKQSGN
jgi:hypothetical protein